MINIDSQEVGKIKYILGGIATISKEAMIEQSSKAGYKTRLAVRGAMLRSFTQWVQYYKGGRRIIAKRNRNNTLGIRIAHRDGGGIDNPKFMSNFITSFTHESTGTTVVGGVHPSFIPARIQNGKIVGTLGRVGGTSKQTMAILEKLNYGNLSGANAKYYNRKGSYEDGSGKKLSDNWKSRRFFEAGWNSVKGEVIRDMTTSLEKMIGQRANNTDLTKEQYA